MIKKCFLFFLFLVSGTILFAEVIKIKEIKVEVDGITRPFAVKRELNIYEGQEFSSEEELDDYLYLSKNQLDDLRIFKEVTFIPEYIPGNSEPREVIVNVILTDTWNIMALPYPKYDSNDGFEMSLRLRDYNFLGLMEPLRINLNYSYDEDGNNQFETELSYTLNFLIADHNFYLSLTESFIYEPEEEYGDDFYMNTSAKFGSTWLLPYDIYEGNHPEYYAYLSGEKDYNFEGMSDDKDQVELGFTHGFDLGQPAWDDNNYREGYAYNLENDWDWEIDEVVDLSATISADMEVHKDLYPLGYSGRVGIVQNLLDDRSDVEGYFRGIKEIEEREAGGFLYMNNALYITVWNSPSFWELHGGPTLDVGYLWNPGEDPDYDSSDPDSDKYISNIAWSIGVEGLCYPAFAKSFVARISIGLSGSGFMDSEGSTTSKIKDNLELYFALGKFF
ncbi:MAG: hypothetical protein PQJ59_19140 [Spirochaetales bacterium]|nr:hypothetical protein [Spirochaetales bacterium]